MKILTIDLKSDLIDIRSLASAAFSGGSDADLNEWFSFDVMKSEIEEGVGACIKVVDDTGSLIGVLYAKQESPINGREGTEKWVIILTAVSPASTGQGVGSALLRSIEELASEHGCKKMFVYTNEDDDEVVKFYQKNGYKVAGSVADYQYGKDNSAVFLLKYL